MTAITQSFNEAIEHLHKQVGNQWVVGTPLGIGKPNPLINALYDHAEANPAVDDEGIELCPAWRLGNRL